MNLREYATQDILKAMGYYELWGKLYRFFQKYADVQENPDFWDGACMEALALSQEYQETPLYEMASQLLHGIMDELGRLYERKYQNNG